MFSLPLLSVRITGRPDYRVSELNLSSIALILSSANTRSVLLLLWETASRGIKKPSYNTRVNN